MAGHADHAATTAPQMVSRLLRQVTELAPLFDADLMRVKRADVLRVVIVECDNREALRMAGRKLQRHRYRIKPGRSQLVVAHPDVADSIPGQTWR